MFRRWFSRTGQLSDGDATVRQAAIEKLSDSQAAEAQDVLVNLLKEDTEPSVRKSAALKVTSIEHLASQLDDDQIGQAVAEILVNKHKSANPELPAHVLGHPVVMQLRLQNVEASELPDLIQHISDVKQIAQLALSSRGEQRSEILAHPELATEAGLAQLEKISRGKDKQCNRYARERLDQLKQQRQETEANLARISEIDQSIQKELKNNPQEAEQVIAQRTKLRKLSQMREELITSVQGLVQASELPTDPLSNVDLFIPEAGTTPFDELCTQLRQLREHIQAGQAVDVVQSNRAEIASAWLTAADKFPPSAQQHQLFEEVSGLFHQYQQACTRLANNDWSGAAQTTNPDRAWDNQWKQH